MPHFKWLLSCALIWSGPAFAGAWTLEKGHSQSISVFTISRADRSFDSPGRTDFQKYLTQTYVAYGLTNSVTLFADPEYTVARATVNGSPSVFHDAAIGAGVRLRLLDDSGVLSVEMSAKTAGAFDMSVAAGGVSGSQAELRLLYGTNFNLFGDSGFTDIEAGERWIARPRPDETPIDATCGLWLAPSTLFMVQSFNIISDGGTASYPPYRSHKLEASLVQRLSQHWKLQLGAFFSPAGRNIIVERGLTLGLWTEL